MAQPLLPRRHVRGAVSADRRRPCVSLALSRVQAQARERRADGSGQPRQPAECFCCSIRSTSQQPPPSVCVCAGLTLCRTDHVIERPPVPVAGPVAGAASGGGAAGAPSRPRSVRITKSCVAASECSRASVGCRGVAGDSTYLRVSSQASRSERSHSFGFRGYRVPVLCRRFSIKFLFLDRCVLRAATGATATSWPQPTHSRPCWPCLETVQVAWNICHFYKQ